jgi:hypothetical protein
MVTPTELPSVCKATDAIKVCRQSRPLLTIFRGERHCQHDLPIHAMNALL